jgi:aminocarboxymuconate-semialdehyde decarboxylase
VIVDVHRHFVPRDLVESFEGFRAVDDAVWPEVLYHRDRHLGPLLPRINDLSLVLEDMDRTGVDVSALCNASWLFCYWSSPSMGARFAREFNDRLAAQVAKHPTRLVGLATVPLQDVDMAIAELRRAVEELDFRGVAVGTNVNGRYFDDPSLLPFLEAAQDLDVPVFFHPDNVAGHDRLDRYRLIQMLGNPHEAALALVRVILGGVMDRLPRIKMCFPQAGGSAPLLLGRIDHTWRVRPEAHAHVAAPPSEYLRRLFFDSIAHSPEPLEMLLRHVSADQVVVGTDYPWDMGEPEAGQSVKQLSSLTDAQRRRILGGNAAQLLKL